jgi:hypothetical protein
MNPDQLRLTRQSLNKAYQLGKPARAALEAFKSRLLALLQQADGQKSEANAKIYLVEILQGTGFAAGYGETPGNSSPVCYAHVPGLRAGFEAPLLPAAPELEINSLPGVPLPDGQTISPALREALLAATFSVRQILSDKGANLPTNVALEYQIRALVYPLFGLKPEAGLPAGAP